MISAKFQTIKAPSTSGDSAVSDPFVLSGVWVESFPLTETALKWVIEQMPHGRIKARTHSIPKICAHNEDTMAWLC